MAAQSVTESKNTADLETLILVARLQVQDSRRALKNLRDGISHMQRCVIESRRTIAETDRLMREVCLSVDRLMEGADVKHDLRPLASS
jgi:hypothetical protein